MFHHRTPSDEITNPRAWKDLTSLRGLLSRYWASPDHDRRSQQYCRVMPDSRTARRAAVLTAATPYRVLVIGTTAHRQLAHDADLGAWCNATGHSRSVLASEHHGTWCPQCFTERAQP